MPDPQSPVGRDMVLDLKISEYKKINNFIAQLSEEKDLSVLHGIKVYRKEGCLIDGNIFKPTHSFLLIWDDDQNKIIPYLLSHGKSSSIPTVLSTETIGFLGQGTFGRVKVIEAQVMSGDGESLVSTKFAVKILKKPISPIELECLKVMEQLKAYVPSSSTDSKSYLVMKLIPGEELVKLDEVKALIFERACHAIARGTHALLNSVVQAITISSNYWLTQTADISNDNKINIAEQLAQQLKTLHDHGYAHMDIKGENIIYNSNTNTATIIDFGLASSIGSPQEVKGTRFYLCPEIATIGDGKVAPSEVTGKEDVFSLGIVFRKELKLHKHPTYGEGFNKLIGKMLEWHPKRRPTMAEVLREIHAIKTVQLATVASPMTMNPVVHFFNLKREKKSTETKQSLEDSKRQVVAVM